MAVTRAETITFLWEGRDKRGVKLKGQQVNFKKLADAAADARAPALRAANRLRDILYREGKNAVEWLGGIKDTLGAYRLF